MKIIQPLQFIPKLLELSNLNTSEVKICSYGLFIDDNSSKILDNISKVKNIKSEFIIGSYKYRSCKLDGSECEDCIQKYKNYTDRLNSYITKYKNINFTILNDIHLKMYYFKTKKDEYLITGGINFTNSTWSDSAILFKNSNSKEESDLIQNYLKQFSELKLDKINFGKNKGQTVEWIKKNDKSYYQWLMNNKLVINKN